MKNEKAEIEKLVNRISKAVNVDKTQKKDTISRLIGIDKMLVQKKKLEKENEKRINDLLSLITDLAQLNYKKKAKISNKFDHIDALALGINMLGEELQSSTISLKEKKILLQEVHHRVKNNLQIILSLLNLQSHFISDPVLQEKFQDTQNRVRAMALVHEKLHESKEASRINFPEYVKDFVNAVNRSYNTSEGYISIHTEIAKEVGYVKIDTAIPCALILNELISNCFKHAFPKSKKGNIRLYLGKTGSKECIIKVVDDGIGIRENTPSKKSSSLGLQLIEMLVEQIGGKLSMQSKNGTTVIVRFKPAI